MTTERELGEEGARRGGLPNGQCSKGWGDRCAASKGKRCKCACGGANHGRGSAQLSLSLEERAWEEARQVNEAIDYAIERGWLKEVPDEEVPA